MLHFMIALLIAYLIGSLVISNIITMLNSKFALMKQQPKK